MIDLLRGLLHRVQARLDPTKDTIRRLAGIPLEQGAIAIDCGANVGDITAILARDGATVYAFEPNPHAFERLTRRFANAPNVKCLQQGVAGSNGRAKLFFHKQAGEDPVFWSTGSSVLDFKSNVDTGTFADVETIDLAEFVKSLGQAVEIVKMDVEGVECPIVNRLIDSGAIGSIRHLFVETHDHRIPELADETQALRERVAREGLSDVIDLTWK